MNCSWIVEQPSTVFGEAVLGALIRRGALNGIGVRFNKETFKVGGGAYCKEGAKSNHI